MNYVEQRPHGVDVQAPDHGRFLGVGFRDDHAGNFPSSGFEGNGEGTSNAAYTAVEREFSDKKAIRHFLPGETAIGTDDAERHGQVEPGTFFLDVGRGKVDSDVGGRNVVAAVFQRGADAVASFAHSCVGQADGVEVVLIALDARAVDFYLNNVGIDAVDGGAQRLVKHVNELRGIPPLLAKKREKWGTQAHEVPVCQIATLGARAPCW